MILIKEKLRMMLRSYVIKICYARILMCKFAFLFPQKRGMKISPSNNQWNARMALASCNSTWQFEIPEPMKD